MTTARAYAAPSAGAPLVPMTIERRDPVGADVEIAIEFAGICHSDIHQAREEWGGSIFPMVPGHEITGTVTAVGPNVTKYAVGDRVGVGVMVDTCRECDNCKAGQESYCQGHVSPTYNGYEPDRTTPTYGGYSTSIVVDERYVLRIPDALPLDAAAPLLCAGITLYAPLREWGAGPGKKVGIVGLGGLGHMGVKIAHAMGAEVTVFSHSERKRDDALRLGADHYVNTSDESTLKPLRDSFDLIISTVSAPMDLTPYFNMLGLDGTLVLVGLPETPPTISPFALAARRRRFSSSNTGGLRETQEMLDFCAEHGITSDIEIISADGINDAWERVVASDVRYRAVIDTSTLV